MTDEPKANTGQVRPQEFPAQSGRSTSGDGRSTSPSPGSTFGDPAPLEFGDKPDDGSKTADPSKTSEESAKGNNPRSAEESDEDAGEGHKGPRVDATTVPSDHRS
jgi:hypothetical protein